MSFKELLEDFEKRCATTNGGWKLPNILNVAQTSGIKASIEQIDATVASRSKHLVEHKLGKCKRDECVHLEEDLEFWKSFQVEMIKNQYETLNIVYNMVKDNKYLNI